MKKLKIKTIEKGINENSFKKLSNPMLSQTKGGGCRYVAKFCPCVMTVG
jgi:hypothetical protein